jgi:RHS repeat-associated protein
VGAHLYGVRDAKGQQYHFHYNALGWLDHEVDPRRRATVYQYDENGNVTLRVNRRGQAVHFGYDELDNLRSRTADGSMTSYHTDPAGRFLSEDPIGLAGGINLYAYAANNPVDNTDPFGLFPCTHEQANRGECAKPLQGIVASVCRHTGERTRRNQPRSLLALRRAKEPDLSAILPHRS